jgi:carboxyl-terminal processing protease
MRARSIVVALGILSGCRASAISSSPPADDGVASSPSSVASAPPIASAVAAPARIERGHAVSSGGPTRLTCEAARAIVADVRARMAVEPTLPSTPEIDAAFGDSVVDWIDPHGLWTASPDSPVAPLVRRGAATLRAAIEGRAECAAATDAIGRAMVAWIGALRREHDAGAKSVATSSTAPAAPSSLGEGAFEDGAVTRPARSLARDLGVRSETALRSPTIGAALTEDVATARARWLPSLDAAAWGEVVLAASVRAWVPLVDPHGAWAPLEESSMLFDRDLEVAPPIRLWSASTRTVLGVRIDAGPQAPLREGDVVLSVGGASLAGLSAESIDQLSEQPMGDDEARDASRLARTVRVVRGGKLLTLQVATLIAEEPIGGDALPTHAIAYGDGRVLIVRVDDVPDDLGDQLVRALADARRDVGSPTISGVILDLRGNGGGSIDGAASALGVFLPGAPLFPLRHRGGTIETERAGEPPIEDQWQGPVAAFVDSGTASAAEMIAGALRAYRRGVVVGAQTYGKGCAQEYVDDASSTGLVRMTTLMFAQPDGAGVQRVGVRPDIAIAFPSPLDAKDREAELPRSAPAWSGPDVRDLARVHEVAWAPVKRVGPCPQVDECSAIEAIARSAQAGGTAKR